MSFTLRNLPVRAFITRAQMFSTTLARRRSSCPPSSPNQLLTHTIKHVTVSLRVLQRPTRLSATVPSASRVPPLAEGHQIGTREDAHRIDTTLTQPNHRRVSTDRPKRVDSQVVPSLAGESGPTTYRIPFCCATRRTSEIFPFLLCTLFSRPGSGLATI